MNTEEIKHYLDTLPLVEALWWFIENCDNSEVFFHLRERVRQHHANGPDREYEILEKLK